MFQDFYNCKTGILLICENAAKNFTMPTDTHCIIYYDPPQSACSVNNKLSGCTRRIILFLRQHESSFLELLEHPELLEDPGQFEITPMHKSSVQGKIENLTAEVRSCFYLIISKHIRKIKFYYP